MASISNIPPPPQYYTSFHEIKVHFSKYGGRDPYFDIPHNIIDKFDVLSYLFTAQRNYLIRINNNGGEQGDKVYAHDLKTTKYIAIFCFYIPVIKHDSVGLLCYHLQQMFLELRDDGHRDFEFVLVPRMRPDLPDSQDSSVASAAFCHFISAFPGFLTVPFSDSDSFSRVLFPLVATYLYDDPQCVVADLEQQKVVLNHINAFKTSGAYLYPFTCEKLDQLSDEEKTIGRSMPLETLLGCRTSDVLNRVGSGIEGETVLGLKDKVIWIYLLYKGRFLDEICALYNLCKSLKYEFEVVLVNAMCIGDAWNMGVEEEYRCPLNTNPLCSEWLVLPRSHKVSRRLWCFSSAGLDGDRLLTVGPNGSYVEPHALEHYLHYGIGTYPFTKQAIWDGEVDRLRRLQLLELLQDSGIDYLLDSNGLSVQVSHLRGANVVLYLFDTDTDSRDEWECRVPGWFVEFKCQEEQAGRRFELIFVCTPLKNDESYRDYYREQPWLASPNNGEHLVDAMLKKLVSSRIWIEHTNTLVAFGSDGHLRTLYLQDKLKDQTQLAASFAESQNQPNLVREVGDLVNTMPEYDPFLAF